MVTALLALAGVKVALLSTVAARKFARANGWPDPAVRRFRTPAEPGRSAS